MLAFFALLCVYVRLTMKRQGKNICTPFSVFALSKQRFETLRAAVREQPTLANALEAVCDVFQNHNDVDFTFDGAGAHKPTDTRVALRAADAPRGVVQAVNVNSSAYTARRSGGLLPPRDLRVQRVEVAFHEVLLPSQCCLPVRVLTAAKRRTCAHAASSPRACASRTPRQASLRAS